MIHLAIFRVTHFSTKQCIYMYAVCIYIILYGTMADGIQSNYDSIIERLRSYPINDIGLEIASSGDGVT